jgi:hypothetical protein
MKYEDIPPIDRADAQRILSAGRADRLATAVLAVALHDDNLDFAQDFCLRASAAPDPLVRANAVLGLGHLARRFGRLDQNKVEPIVASALLDDDPYIRGQAEAAADDIQHFTRWRVRRSSRRADA